MIGGVVLVPARDPVRRKVDLLVSVAVSLLLGQSQRPCERRRVMVRRGSARRQHDRSHHHGGQGQAKHGAEESSLHVAGNSRVKGPNPGGGGLSYPPQGDRFKP